MKWRNGEIDETLWQSSNLYTEIPGKPNFNEFIPISCQLDKNCEILKLEFKRERAYKIISKVTGYYHIEDTFSIFLIITFPLVLFFGIKYHLIKRKFNEMRIRPGAFLIDNNPLVEPPPIQQPKFN